MVFAAGLLADSIENLQQLGWLSVLNASMWHSASKLSENSPFGDVLHSFFGYTGAHPDAAAYLCRILGRRGRRILRLTRQGDNPGRPPVSCRPAQSGHRVVRRIGGTLSGRTVSPAALVAALIRSSIAFMVDMLQDSPKRSEWRGWKAQRPRQCQARWRSLCPPIS
jgi:hypothetical protein